MNAITSKDSTSIAYVKQGSGPALILVSAAASDHHDAAKLAELLAAHYTVYNYDRRGRGQSTDAGAYTVEREVEDIEALIELAGGTASLFGSSSGAVLALEAAHALGDKVSKLFLYEPPFIVNEGRAPVPNDYVSRLEALIQSGKRSEAVEYFMTAAVGVPQEFLEFMKADASWKSMESMAHTLAYDGRIMRDTQSGKPLPQGRWKVEAPALVITGENSEAFFQDAAQALVDQLPRGEHLKLAGQDHAAVVMAPDALAEVMLEFAQA
ncbi:alpha/beta hydrolase [Xylanibacillus composti]|nr:alpha/beta hydrolase [Xylanibacillus composti]